MLDLLVLDHSVVQPSPPSAVGPRVPLSHPVGLDTRGIEWLLLMEHLLHL